MASSTPLTPSNETTVSMPVKNVVPESAPTAAQRKWLERGMTQAGGKLPLFDESGRRVSRRIVQTCLENGWAEPWFANRLKPDWLVCRLTEAGRSFFV